MESIGLAEVKDMKELGSLYNNDKEIQEKINSAKALKNIKKPVIEFNTDGTIHKKALDIQVQKRLREIQNPQITTNVQDKLEIIEQELMYNNHDQAVEKIVETLKYLESVRN